MSAVRQSGLYLSAATLLALLSSSRYYFDALTHGRNPPFWPILLNETTALWLAACWVFAVVRASRRFDLRRYLWAYLAAAPVFAALHTLGMYSSRSLLYPFFGLGAYDYGELGYRFIMEAPIQLSGHALTLVAIAAAARMRRAREAERLEGLLAEAQLEQLRLSIGPHFLFNALNTISATVYESAEKADALIGRLSRLLRALISAAPQQTCTLKRELQWVDEYLALQQARFEDRLNVSIDCRAPLKSARVPFMILQPVIENIFEHGVDSAGKVELSLAFHRHDDQLIVEVGDRGPGLEGSVQGIGTRNTRERIRMLYGPRFGLDLIPRAGGGTLARMTLPWQSE